MRDLVFSSIPLVLTICRLLSLSASGLWAESLSAHHDPECLHPRHLAPSHSWRPEVLRSPRQEGAHHWRPILHVTEPKLSRRDVNLRSFCWYLIINQHRVINKIWFPLSVCLEPPGMVVVLVPAACCLDSPFLPFLAGKRPIYVTIQRVVQIHFKLRYIFVCYRVFFKVNIM